MWIKCVLSIIFLVCLASETLWFICLKRIQIESLYPCKILKVLLKLFNSTLTLAIKLKKKSMFFFQFHTTHDSYKNLKCSYNQSFWQNYFSLTQTLSLWKNSKNRVGRTKWPYINFEILWWLIRLFGAKNGAVNIRAVYIRYGCGLYELAVSSREVYSTCIGEERNNIRLLWRHLNLTLRTTLLNNQPISKWYENLRRHDNIVFKIHAHVFQPLWPPRMWIVSGCPSKTVQDVQRDVVPEQLRF